MNDRQAVIDVLTTHPRFRDLREREIAALAHSAELWESPPGGRLFHPGDAGDAMLLLLSGRWESPRKGAAPRRWFPGDIWGADRIAEAAPVESVLFCRQASRWIRWSRTDLRAFVQACPGSLRRLSPEVDLAGIPQSPRTAGRARADRNHRLRPSLRPVFAVAVLTGLVVAAWRAISPGGSPGLAMIPGIPGVLWIASSWLYRLTRVYRLEEDHLSTRELVWRRFTVESRKIPLDRIQGVETGRIGLLEKLMGIGSVTVKTAARDGEVVMRGLARPDAIRRRIIALRERRSALTAGRDKEAWRRDLESRTAAGRSPRIVLPAVPGPQRGRKSPTGDGVVTFRKSIAVLLAKIFFPALLTGAFVAASVILPASREVFRIPLLAGTVVPLLWLLWRFEDWRNDRFMVSGGYLLDLDRKPLGKSETRNQVELTAIQNIRTEQRGIFSFLFRYGNVIIVTAGGAADAVFESVARPRRVQELLFHRREEALARQEEVSRARRREEILTFAEAARQAESLLPIPG